MNKIILIFSMILLVFSGIAYAQVIGLPADDELFNVEPAVEPEQEVVAEPGEEAVVPEDEANLQEADSIDVGANDNVAPTLDEPIAPADIAASDDVALTSDNEEYELPSYSALSTTRIAGKIVATGYIPLSYDSGIILYENGNYEYRGPSLGDSRILFCTINSDYSIGSCSQTTSMSGTISVNPGDIVYAKIIAGTGNPPPSEQTIDLMIDRLAKFTSGSNSWLY